MPSATERLYSAIIITGYDRGASFVASERPTGESHSSPTVATSMIIAIHSTGTETTAAIGRNSRKAEPISMMPTPNLRGVIG